MSEAVDEELIASVAREQVAQLAPQELPLFRAQSAAYFEDPQKALQGDRAGEDMLSFGPEVAFALLTPVILSVTSTVLGAVAEELAKTLGEESRGVVGDLVRRLFRRPPAGVQDERVAGERVERGSGWGAPTGGARAHRRAAGQGASVGLRAGAPAERPRGPGQPPGQFARGQPGPGIGASPRGGRDARGTGG